MKAEDQIGDLALVAMDFGGQGCYTNGSYNHNDYLVERGSVTGGGGSFPAYRIQEPSHKASSFLASRHAIYYRFPAVADYSVYRFADGTFSKAADLPAASINPGGFTLVTAANPITVSEIIGSAIYVFVPSATRLSVFTQLAPGVEGATLGATPLGNLLKYRYSVTDTPFDTASGYSVGPGEWNSRYAFNRQFFPLENGAGNIGVLWQDEADLSIQITWFGADLQSPVTIPLPNPRNEELAAATGDGAGNAYYLTIQPGDGAATESARTATLTKVSAAGATLASTALDTSKSGLNMVAFSGSLPNIGSLAYLNGKVGMILGRQMHKSSDGLNHQGAIGVVFDGTTLAVERNWGQTSGHSFESLLTTNGLGEFLGIDLGDNYPRGVNLHKFNAAEKRSRVIHTFKTLHGTANSRYSGDPLAPIPVYSEISGGGTTYYRWSNDNNTYTELGGVAETAGGYTVSFIGEPDGQGHTLNNARVGGYLNDPRNIGLVRVREDFENASGSGSQVSDDLVLTSGVIETGGFYSYGGAWSPQRNAGVVWLTHYADKNLQNASRLKMVPLADGNLLLLWEVWTPNAYVATRGMKVSPAGAILTAESDLGSLVRLNRRDDPLALGERIFLFAGSKGEKKLELIVLGKEEAVNQKPTAAFTLSGASGAAPFTVTVDGGGSSDPDGAIVGYYWSTSDGKSGSGTKINFTFSTPGSYTITLTVTDNQGATGSSQRTITVASGGTPAPDPLPETLSAGGYHSCAIRGDGALACWGDNSFGQSSPPAGSFTQVSAGYLHNCALRSDRSVACWGFNDAGQTSSPAGAFTQVSAGSWHHSCGVAADGSLRCWGDNSKGQSSPPPGIYSQVSAGDYFSCAIRKSDSALVCWGDNAYDQTSAPAGSFVQVDAGVIHACALRNDGAVLCWGSNEGLDGVATGQAIPPMGGYIDVSAGYVHSCALAAGGYPICWGDNTDGQSAPPVVFSPMPATIYTEIAVGDYHSCARRKDGGVDCWGGNYDGQASPPDLTTTVSNDCNPVNGQATIGDRNYTGTASCSASLSIIASNVQVGSAAAAANVTYQAGAFIRLRPNFRVFPGSRFRAFLGGTAARPGD